MLALNSTAFGNSLRRLMFKIVDRYVSFEHCRAVLPWFQFARSREPLPRLRKLILQMEAATSGRGRPNPLLAFFFFVPVSLRQIGIALRQYSKPTRETFRIGYLQQLAGLFYLSWRLNHSPHDYYLQKMWLRPDRRTWSQFIQQREHVTFVKHLQRTLPIDKFDDKLEFFRHMKAADVPTIEVLLAASGGHWLEGFPAGRADGMLQQDLVIKPTNGAMYDGVEVWRYTRQTNSYIRAVFEKKPNGTEQWISDEKSDLTGLLARVLTLSAKRTYIIQACMKNNPALEPISPHSIANFRIVTAQHHGRVKVIAAIIRMGYDNQNFIPGTYQANIALETGALGFATGRHAQWGFGETHLETGARVTGRRIDRWPQLQAIAIRGHEQYPWMPTIGWDAIDSDQGPMLMEANAFWGVDIAQVDAPFLGEVGYAEACFETYERKVGNEPRPLAHLPISDAV